MHDTERVSSAVAQRNSPSGASRNVTAFYFGKRSDENGDTYHTMVAFCVLT